jgi:hypothetical protein
MQIWALARFTKEEIPIEFSKLPARDMMLCSKAIEILSVNKEHFFRLYQKYVENCDKQKIRNLHLNNRYLRSIAREFVSFYFNGDVKRTNNLLDSAYKITNLDSVGLLLSQLHEEMAKSAQLNSYEAFRLFNLVKFHMSWNNDDFSFLSSNDQELFKQLKEKANVCLRQLLWQEHTTKFAVVNKFFNATLSSQEDNNSIVCFDLGDKRSNQTWKINIGKWTSLLTLTHAQKKLQLVTDKESSPCLFETAEPWWKVKMVDEHHFKIFHETKGR